MNLNQRTAAKLTPESALAQPRAVFGAGPRPWHARLHDKLLRGLSQDWVLLPIAGLSIAAFGVGVVLEQPKVDVHWQGHGPATVTTQVPGQVVSPGTAPGVAHLEWPDRALLDLRDTSRPNPEAVLGLIDRLEAHWAQPQAHAHNAELWAAARTLCAITDADEYRPLHEVPGDDQDWVPEQRAISQWRRHSACDEAFTPAVSDPQSNPVGPRKPRM